MREILYRSISMAKGEHWLYGHPRHYAHNPHTEKWTMYDPTTRIETDIDEDTLGQYTGLQDMNGNKIFEGDIVKCNNKVEEYIGLVDWDACNPSMCIRFKSENGFNHVEYDFIKCGNMTIKILGNRWDNPDLLKGGEQ